MDQHHQTVAELFELPGRQFQPDECSARTSNKASLRPSPQLAGDPCEQKTSEMDVIYSSIWTARQLLAYVGGSQHVRVVGNVHLMLESVTTLEEFGFVEVCTSDPETADVMHFYDAVAPTCNGCNVLQRSVVSGEWQLVGTDSADACHRDVLRGDDLPTLHHTRTGVCAVWEWACSTACEYLAANASATTTPSQLPTTITRETPAVTWDHNCESAAVAQRAVAQRMASFRMAVGRTTCMKRPENKIWLALYLIDKYLQTMTCTVDKQWHKLRSRKPKDHMQDGHEQFSLPCLCPATVPVV